MAKSEDNENCHHIQITFKGVKLNLKNFICGVAEVLTKESF